MRRLYDRQIIGCAVTLGTPRLERVFVGTKTLAQVEELPAERLEAELTTLAAHMHAGMYRFLVMVAEFDRRGLYESWECRSTAEWLSWKCAMPARTAREQVRVARALEKLPLAAAAFGRGELSYAKVRAMARVAGVVAEEELMHLATEATARATGTDSGHVRPPPRQGDQGAGGAGAVLVVVGRRRHAATLGAAVA